MERDFIRQREEGLMSEIKELSKTILKEKEQSKAYALTQIAIHRNQRKHQRERTCNHQRTLRQNRTAEGRGLSAGGEQGHSHEQAPTHINRERIQAALRARNRDWKIKHRKIKK